MSDSADTSGSTEAQADAIQEAEEKFEHAARDARNELQQANEEAESQFYAALRNAAPKDPQVIASAQARLARALADSREAYRLAIAKAEGARIQALAIITARTCNRAQLDTESPLSGLVRRLARQLAAERALRLSPSPGADDTPPPTKKRPPP